MIVEKIKQELEKIRPQLQMDGGDVEFVSFDDKTGELQVKLKGACVGCPMSQMTLEHGIGEAIKEEIGEVKKVIGV